MPIYLGSADDVVAKFPRIGERSYHMGQALGRAALLLSEPILINDGYLLQSKWAIDDISKRENSLIGKLAKKKFFKIFGRTQNLGDASAAFEKSANKAPHLTERQDKAERIEDVKWLGRLLAEVGGFESWPTEINTGFGFYFLMGNAYASVLSDKEAHLRLGLGAFPRTVILGILEQFFEEFHKNTMNGPRGVLEGVLTHYLVDFAAPTEHKIALKSSIMQLANEFYHYNMAAIKCACSSAEEMIYVESYFSPRLLSLLDFAELQHDVDEETLEINHPNVGIPENIDPALLLAFAEFADHTSEAGQSKLEMLRNRNELFVNGASRSEYIRAAADYEKRIYRVRNKVRDDAHTSSVERIVDVGQNRFDVFDLVWEIADHFPDLHTGVPNLLRAIGVDRDSVAMVLNGSKDFVPPVMQNFGLLAQDGTSKVTVDKRIGSGLEAMYCQMKLNHQKCRHYLELVRKIEEDFPTRPYVDLSGT